MIIFLNLLAILALSFVADGDEKMGCNFSNHLDGSRKKGEDQIEVLKGKRFEVSDNSDDGYIYNIGICVDAVDQAPDGIDIKGVGVLQTKKKEGPEPKIIGMYNKADIMAGPEWVILEYLAGEKYNNHCPNDEGRRAKIMFICDPDKLDEEPIILEEQRNKTEDCYYLFEIGTSAVCPKQPFITVGLSVGSVLLIV